MTHPTFAGLRQGVLVAALLAFSGCAAPAVIDEAGPATLVYLVRHAEKTADDPRDPSLSEEGVARADALSLMLADAGIDHIFSSDFKRTRDTAAPLALALGLEAELYDPGALPVLVDSLKGMQGRILVVGHSNTTPQLAQLLGGGPVAEMPETEYDRLYVVTLVDGDVVASTLLRFGEVSH